MAQLPSSETIAQSLAFKIQDLQIWYNPTVFSSVSALIRTETHQFPLLIKDYSQGKLKLKNKLITNLQCSYDIRKHKYLPLKIQVDITLEYKGGKTLIKRFMINLNEFKTGINKTQRIKILKSVQRMFSVEIVFKLQNLSSSTHSHYTNENSHSTFKSDSKLSSFKSNQLSAMKHVRVPKTQVIIQVIKPQIQQVRSLNAKEMMKSPKRMSDFLLASKKSPTNRNIISNKDDQIRRNEKNMVSPNKGEYNHYRRHLENGLVEEGVEIKNSYVSYVKGDPYVLEEHKLYATITPSQDGNMQNSSSEKLMTNGSQNLTNKELNHPTYRIKSMTDEKSHVKNLYRDATYQQSRQGVTPLSQNYKIETSHHKIVEHGQIKDQRQINSLLMEQVRDLRKKLSDLLYEKNKLYAQKENNLLEYETRDKEQKIRHRKELTQQKDYYEELLRRKQIQLQEYRFKWSSIPTEVKQFNYYENQYQLQTLDDSSERNLSITFQHEITNRKQTRQGQNKGIGRKQQFNYHNLHTDMDNHINNGLNRDNHIYNGVNRDMDNHIYNGVNGNREKKRIFESTPTITGNSNQSNNNNNKKPNPIIINEDNHKNNHKNTKIPNQSTNITHTPTSTHLNKPLINQLQDLSQIESSRNVILKLKQQLQDKNKLITDLLKYKSLAHQQENQLTKLNQLINQLNLQHQYQQEPSEQQSHNKSIIRDNHGNNYHGNSHQYGFMALSTYDDTHHSHTPNTNPHHSQLNSHNPEQQTVISNVNLNINNNNQHPDTSKQVNHNNNQHPHTLNKVNSPLNHGLNPPQPNQYHQQLQDICSKLSTQIQVMQEKILFLQNSNKTLNHQYNNKLQQLNHKQQQLLEDQQKLQSLQSELSNQINQLKQLQQELNQQNLIVNTSNQLLTQHQQQLLAKDHKLTETNTKLKNKDILIEKQQHQIEELKSIIAQLNSKINSLIQINSELYSNIQQLQNSFKSLPNQQPQIILHNYHLNPTNDQILNLTPQLHLKDNLPNPNNNNLVKVPSILRINKTQTNPEKPINTHHANSSSQYQPNPNTNNQYILLNDHHNQNPLKQNNLNYQIHNEVQALTQKLNKNITNLERDMQTLNQQDAKLNSIIRNNYHKQSLLRDRNLSIQGKGQNSNKEFLIKQNRTDDYNYVSPNSVTKPQEVNANNKKIIDEVQKKKQNLTINLNPPFESNTQTTKLIRIEQTPQKKIPPHQQYPNQPVKIKQENTPRPLKNPQTINKPNTDNTNFNDTKNNPSNNPKYTMKTVYYSAQKEPKASSIGARTYRSSKNQKKRTRAGRDDSDGCGCC